MNRQIEGRPALALAASLMLGISASLHVGNLLLVIPILLLFRAPAVRMGGVFLVALGWAMSPVPSQPVNSESAFSGSLTIVGPAHDRPGQPATPLTRALPPSVSFVAQSARGRLLVNAPPGDYAFDERILAQGTIKPRSLDAPDLVDVSGVIGRMTIKDFKVLAPAPIWFRAAASTKAGFERLAMSDLSPIDAELLAAIGFNSESMLPDELSDQLRRTGSMHFVAASGLHVMLLLALVIGLASLFRLPRSAQLAFAFAVVGFFALATGWNPPVVRASLTAAIILPAYLAKRDPDLLSALAISAIIVLVAQPEQLFSAGFQLSYTVVAAFGLFYRYRPAHSNSWTDAALSAVLRAFGASVFAGAIASPLLAYHFGSISLISPLANVLIAIAFAPIFVGGLVAYALSFVSPSAAAWVLQGPVVGMLDWVRWVLAEAASPSWASVRVQEFNAYWLLIAYIGIALLWNAAVRLAPENS